MTAVEILTTARLTLANPAHWTKGVPARNSLGGSTGVDSPTAVCWCISGALAHVAPNHDNKAYFEAATYMVRATGDTLLGDWNDAPERTHAEVLVMFDVAIALAQSEESINAPT